MVETRRGGLLGECVGLAPHGETVVSCSDDGRVQIWKKTVESLDVEGQVSAFDILGERVAVGGRDHELSVWNLATSDREWRARNVPNDMLDLRKPVWVSAARFRTETTLVVGTKHRQLRLYDSRAQRRPVADVENATDHAVRQLMLLDENTALVADVAGSVQIFDLRKSTIRLRARYPGPAGSVRALARSGPLFAAAGLDRHVHIWDYEARLTAPKKRPMLSIYCKQRLNALLWMPSLSTTTTDHLFPTATVNDDDESNDDDQGSSSSSEEEEEEEESEDDDA